MRPLELYIHIPFCVKKCRYCDFLSAPATPEARQEYVMGLCQKIRSYYDLAGMYHVSSIFIGGGTPSILETQQMRSIFDADTCYISNCSDSGDHGRSEPGDSR